MNVACLQGRRRMALNALALAIAQMPDPNFRGVAIKAFVLTLLLFAGMVWFELWLIDTYLGDELARLAIP